MRELTSVRFARPDDADAIVRVVNDAFDIESFFKSAPRTTPEDVRALMRSGQFLVLDCPSGGLAGAVYLSIDGSRGYLGMLSVDPATQGQGIGRLLQNAAEERCRDAGCSLLEIHIVDIRPELKPYYERLGFAANGEVRPFPHPEHATRPCHLIVMTKPLG